MINAIGNNFITNVKQDSKSINTPSFMLQPQLKNDTISFGSAKDLKVAKEMMINLINHPENLEILQSGNRLKIGEKLLELKNNLTQKILDFNPGSSLNAITKEDTLIYNKNGEYIGAISQIPSGECPINVDYFDSTMKKFVGVEITPIEILGNSRARYYEKPVV